VTAAMVDGTGLRALKSGKPERVFDVGIAEEHAVTFAAGMALAGLRPVVAIYSTFMQRAVDQVIHDVAIPRLPVIFAIDRAGLVAGDGETHQGIFDVGLFSSIPGLTIFCPSCSAEVEKSLRWALERGGPVIIRYPKAVCGPDLPELTEPIEEGRGVFIRRHQSEVLLMTVGGILPEALKAAHILNLRGISTDIYCARFVKPIDAAYLEKVVRQYERILLVEETVARGGLGELVARMFVEKGIATRFHALCVPEAFMPQGARSDLLRASGLDGESIARRVESFCANPEVTATQYQARLGRAHPLS
jgi:1-deoxy-D-xylulose-5-phosphate synthase